MTLNQLCGQLPRMPKITKHRRADLTGAPQRRGTCLKVHAITPRKPNSAKRKIARVLLSNYCRINAYLPGLSMTDDSLKKHSIVLIRGGRVKDLPGLRYTIIRGKYDPPRIPTRRNKRSKYGTPTIKADLQRGAYYKKRIW